MLLKYLYFFHDSAFKLFGKVVEGMEHVDNIKRGEPGSGTVDDPDVMISVKVLADIQ